EPYLKQCIDSIKQQTFDDFEVLAILDCPTDNSEVLLRELADERFRIIKNEKKLGLAACCNNILELSNCSLIARMDADDIMLPLRIERQLEFLTEHPDIDILGTYFEEIDPNGKQTAKPFPMPLKHEDILDAFRRMSVMHHPTVMYRRDRIRSLGGYDTTYPLAQDLDLWFRCFLNNFRFANLPEVLLHYRVYPGRLTSRKLEIQLQMVDRAYAIYGKQIWGEQAPDFVSGINPWHRLWRRIKRKLSN
ncbi:glycosyltransferase, partial [bacterium]|nr:glycosyltransferase [bacterium]